MKHTVALFALLMSAVLASGAAAAYTVSVNHAPAKRRPHGYRAPVASKLPDSLTRRIF